jgi:hypothetical protein
MLMREMKEMFGRRPDVSDVIVLREYSPGWKEKWGLKVQ